MIYTYYSNVLTGIKSQVLKEYINITRVYLVT